MALESPPLFDPPVVAADPRDPAAARLPKLVMGFEWLRWFQTLGGTIDQAPARKTRVSVRVSQASIGTTPLPIGAVGAGMWRLSYFARIHTVAGVSSSLTVGFSYVVDGVTQSDAGAAITGNLTTTHQFGTLVIRVDVDTPISYSTTYASDAAGIMAYDLDIVAEELAIDTV